MVVGVGVPTTWSLSNQSARGTRTRWARCNAARCGTIGSHTGSIRLVFYYIFFYKKKFLATIANHFIF